MANGTVNDVVAWMAESRVLEPGQHEEVQRLVQSGLSAPRSLAKELIARGWLTPFQANFLVQGRIQDLVFNQYVILDRIGEGGMGTVYKAKHQKLGRIVALKVIKKEYLAHASAAKRFRREIQAAAQLTHPNIVLALDSDVSGETHYYAMEYIEGIDLRGLLKKSGPLQVGQACDYMRQAALGLQHAFERGLVHRDIKPSNIFVTTKASKGSNAGTMGPWGLVKILDLGLARAAADADVDWTNTLTCAGAVVGTPDYIAPEQARDSRTADIRSDIYSLGCSFYHLLTGQVPYPGGTGMEKLFKHQLEDAKPIRQFRKDVPKEVEAVIKRAMAKKPEDRYQTPAELAKALEPLIKKARATSPQPLPDSAVQDTVLAHDPAAVTPPGTPKKRSSQVKPAVDALAGERRRRPIGLAIACCVGGLILLTGLLFAIFSGGTDGPVASTQTSTTTAQTTKQGGTGPGPVVKNGGVLDLLSRDRIAAAERTADLPAEAVAVLGDSKLRHWGQVMTAAFSPDGTLLATGGGDRALRVWETATGKLRMEIDDFVSPPSHAAFSSDGKSLTVVGYDLTVRVHDVSSGAPRGGGAIPRLEGSPLALSPDGRSLLMMGAKSRVWDVTLNQERFALDGGAGAMGSFSANGQYLVSFSRGGGGTSSDLTVWDVFTGEPRRLPSSKEPVLSAAVSNDGRLAVVAETKQITLFETASGQVLGRLELPAAAVGQLALSPDGRALAIVANGRARLLNLANPAKPVWERRSSQYSSRLVFSPDGSMLASAGYEPVVHLYDAATGQEKVPGSRFHASQAAFAGDGGSLIAGGPSGVTRWDLATLTPRLIEGIAAHQQVAAVSGDGRRLVARGSDGVSVWDAVTGARLGQVAAQAIGAYAVVSADGLVAAVITPAERSVQVWDLTTYQARPALQGFAAGQGMPTLGLSANGRVLAIGEQGVVRLWDTISGKPLGTPLGTKTSTRFAGLAISPDGRQAAASGDGQIRWWDIASGQEIVRSAAAANKGILNLQFSPDGGTLVAWGPQQLLAWDTASGKPRGIFSGGLAMLRSVTFSADGKWLGAADQEGRVQVWETASGTARHLVQLPGPAASMAFAADGRHIATVNSNGTVYILRLGQKAEKAPAAAAPLQKRLRAAILEVPVEPAQPFDAKPEK